MEMDSCCEEDECRFYDACDDIAVSSECDSGCFESDASCSGSEAVCSGSQFDVWVQKPLSIEERRNKFFNWLGMSASEASSNEGSAGFDAEVDRLTAMARCLSFDHEFSSSRSSVSSWSGRGSELREGLSFEESLLSRSWVCDNDEECIDGELKNECGEVNSSKLAVMERLEHSHLSPPINREDYSGVNIDVNDFRYSEKGGKNWWLKKLRSFTCVDNNKGQNENFDSLLGGRLQRVKVRQCNRKHRELSALYSSQDFQAHEGSILAMKFSPDGRYLASAGEDRVVRVWKVVEDERSNEVNIPDTNPLCLYFKMNHGLELEPIYAEKERMGKTKSWSRNAGSACVILPPKVFRLLEKPFHEFKGHLGEISDLSWSKNNCLLSSSVDKTVRLWRVGFNRCLKVFSHNNYVTSIQFNPMDDNYFISGSIDGKVRIWEISDCRVVSWTDIKDIVTAVSYHPDGQGVLVGSIAGFCRFYKISDGQLDLDVHISLRGKKKSPGKRIIGFQYCPQDSSKVMVICADSQVRILKGMDVVGKYKGSRGSGNYLSASFTGDGNHIVSACEDSNVYIWNCVNHDDQDPSRNKKAKTKSYERFQSTASLAIPWNGFQNVNTQNGYSFDLPGKTTSQDSPSIFPLEQDFFLESYYPKGSQTWPEENLPAPAHLHLISSMQKFEYKFLRACQSISSPHIWGLVIVSAGLDGRIRSFHNYGLPVPL